MDLKELLGVDLYNQVMQKAGDEHKIAVVSDGTWFPKSKFDEVNEQKKRLESQLSERDKQLKELQVAAGNNEELKKQITELQKANDDAKKKYEADMNELRLNTALKVSLANEAYDPDIVINLLDKSKIELDDSGNVKTGLEDQLKALRESKGFLFVQKEDNKQTFKGFKPAEGKDNDGSRDTSYNIGKQLAELQAKRNEGLDQARDSYFT